MKIVRPFNQIPNINRDEYNEKYTNCFWIEGIFNKAEVKRIRELWNEETADDSKVVQGGNTFLKSDTRQSRHLYLPAETHAWIYDKISMACILANAGRFKFDILGFDSEVKLVKYSRDSFFEWHIDYGSGKISVRKISFSIQLSDAEEYEGGDVQFKISNNNIITAPKKQGTIVFFPSFILHRVTKITSGTRMAIVGHIAGPPFR